MQLNKNGKQTGAVPLYQRVPEACRLAQALRHRGASYALIRRQLEAAGFKSRTGKPFGCSSISTMLSVPADKLKCAPKDCATCPLRATCPVASFDITTPFVRKGASHV